MPYYNPNPISTPQQKSTNYVEYVDDFKAENVTPTCGINNFLMLFDNFDDRNTLESLENKDHKLYQMTTFYVLNGECVLNINGKDVTIKAGQTLTTMPDNVVSFVSASEDVKYFMLLIYPKVVNIVFNDLGVNYTNSDFSRAFFVNDTPQERFQYCYDLYKVIKSDMLIPPYEYKLIYLRSLLNDLFVQNFLTHDIDIQKEGDSNSRQYDVYCKFLEALNKYSTEHRSVQFYAELLGISSKYLSFVCISYSKQNASTWIDKYVIQKAKVLMTVHDYSMSEVSEMLHFQTTSSFSRYFKRVTGITPKEFISKKH